MRDGVRRFSSAQLSTPPTQLLSNGRYSALLTAAGSGYSRWQDLMVSRWYEDATCDAQGSYVFVRDVHDGQIWSAGYQPTGREPDSYAVSFTDECAQFVRHDGSLVTELTCCVVDDEDAELRRVSLSNQGRTARTLELTSYLEVVMAAAGADAAHPAFVKMFVQTEFDAASGTLLAVRRPRDAAEAALCVCHCLSVEGTTVGSLQFETDRARFIGRGHELRQAVSIIDARPLSGTVGTVLDAVLSLRRRVHLEPGERVSLNFWTGAASNREAALALARRLHRPDAAARARAGARRKAETARRQLGLTADDAAICQDIAGRLLYADAALRAPRAVLDANTSGPRAVWPHGLSGDRPLLLLRLVSETGLRLVTPLLRAQEYLRLKGLTFDFAVLNEVDSQPEVQTTLAGTLKNYRASLAGGDSGRGVVVVIEAVQLDRAAFDAVCCAARVILFGDGTDLNDQLEREIEVAPRRRLRRENPQAAAGADAPPAATAQEFFNGLGGFAAEGREYLITLSDGQWTPAPWVNVIANPQFGFLASADGTGSTWYHNAQQNPLTPWCNDPVGNAPAEAVYLRDESNGDLWSATPLPVRDPAATYVVRHGFGYTRVEHASHGIALELTQFVPLADAVKIARLTVTNRGPEPRRLSVTHYVDWVLGKERGRNEGIVTLRHPASGALLARNPRSLDYAGQIAFLDAGDAGQAVTGDRREFIGRHGSLAEPAVLLGLGALSNRTGGGMDPCGVTQTLLELAPGECRELRLLLGAGESEAQVAALIEQYRQISLEAVLRAVTEFWERTLGALQVKTPDRSMDLMLNGWLLYQLIASRLWGRTGFYQSSGAYGYRDQLQDVMALCVAAPQETRAHILRAAARQFIEGDVQHWWLPTTGQGIRTRIADDRLWLPHVVARYVEVTQDAAVLDEPAPYLGGAPLAPGEAERFEAPPIVDAEPLYQHCVRALDSALTMGSHGLPLFGTGDWNDGMNRVGIGGRGESVWLGWFLYATLTAFALLAERRGDTDKATRWRSHAQALAQSLEREAWDGDWYRRGYFDDGTPLGSVSNEECRIDSIAQSWAVLSHAAPRAHALQAMSAVNAQLVSRSDGLIKLFAPAFDRSAHDPGYIKAYPPGLRENGGQYTHGAVWNVLAFASLGHGERAAELFSLLNPVNHASTRAGIHRYKVEPYVMCADVYAAPGHVGRGGWTWYTGSAGWMYRAGIEGLLGIEVRGDRLLVEPRIPKSWAGFEFTLKFGASRYRIEVDNRRASAAALRVSLDGKDLPVGEPQIELIDDDRYHYGKITLARDG